MSTRDLPRNEVEQIFGGLWQQVSSKNSEGVNERIEELRNLILQKEGKRKRKDQQILLPTWIANGLFQLLKRTSHPAMKQKIIESLVASGLVLPGVHFDRLWCAILNTDKESIEKWVKELPLDGSITDSYGKLEISELSLLPMNFANITLSIAAKASPPLGDMLLDALASRGVFLEHDLLDTPLPVPPHIRGSWYPALAQGRYDFPRLAQRLAKNNILFRPKSVSIGSIFSDVKEETKGEPEKFPIGDDDTSKLEALLPFGRISPFHTFFLEFCSKLSLRSVAKAYVAWYNPLEERYIPKARPSVDKLPFDMVDEEKSEEQLPLPQMSMDDINDALDDRRRLESRELEYALEDVKLELPRGSYPVRHDLPDSHRERGLFRALCENSGMPFNLKPFLIESPFSEPIERGDPPPHNSYRHVGLLLTTWSGRVPSDTISRPRDPAAGVNRSDYTIEENLAFANRWLKHGSPLRAYHHTEPAIQARSDLLPPNHAKNIRKRIGASMPVTEEKEMFATLSTKMKKEHVLESAPPLPKGANTSPDTTSYDFKSTHNPHAAELDQAVLTYLDMVERSVGQLPSKYDNEFEIVERKEASTFTLSLFLDTLHLLYRYPSAVDGAPKETGKARMVYIKWRLRTIYKAGVRIRQRLYLNSLRGTQWHSPLDRKTREAIMGDQLQIEKLFEILYQLHEKSNGQEEGVILRLLASFTILYNQSWTAELVQYWKTHIREIEKQTRGKSNPMGDFIQLFLGVTEICGSLPWHAVRSLLEMSEFGLFEQEQDRQTQRDLKHSGGTSEPESYDNLLDHLGALIGSRFGVIWTSNFPHRLALPTTTLPPLGTSPSSILPPLPLETFKAWDRTSELLYDIAFRPHTCPLYLFLESTPLSSHYQLRGGKSQKKEEKVRPIAGEPIKTTLAEEITQIGAGNFLLQQSFFRDDPLLAVLASVIPAAVARSRRSDAFLIWLKLMDHKETQNERKEAGIKSKKESIESKKLERGSEKELQISILSIIFEKHSIELLENMILRLIGAGRYDIVLQGMSIFYPNNILSHIVLFLRALSQRRYPQANSAFNQYVQIMKQIKAIMQDKDNKLIEEKKRLNTFLHILDDPDAVVPVTWSENMAVRLLQAGILTALGLKTSGSKYVDHSQGTNSTIEGCDRTVTAWQGKGHRGHPPSFRNFTSYDRNFLLSIFTHHQFPEGPSIISLIPPTISSSLSLALPLPFPNITATTFPVSLSTAPPVILIPGYEVATKIEIDEKNKNKNKKIKNEEKKDENENDEEAISFQESLNVYKDKLKELEALREIETQLGQVLEDEREQLIHDFTSLTIWSGLKAALLYMLYLLISVTLHPEDVRSLLTQQITTERKRHVQREIRILHQAILLWKECVHESRGNQRTTYRQTVTRLSERLYYLLAIHDLHHVSIRRREETEEEKELKEFQEFKELDVETKIKPIPPVKLTEYRKAHDKWIRHWRGRYEERDEEDPRGLYIGSGMEKLPPLTSQQYVPWLISTRPAQIEPIAALDLDLLQLTMDRLLRQFRIRDAAELFIQCSHGRHLSPPAQDLDSSARGLDESRRSSDSSNGGDKKYEKSKTRRDSYSFVRKPSHPSASKETKESASTRLWALKYLLNMVRLLLWLCDHNLDSLSFPESSIYGKELRQLSDIPWLDEKLDPAILAATTTLRIAWRADQALDPHFLLLATLFGTRTSPYYLLTSSTSSNSLLQVVRGHLLASEESSSRTNKLEEIEKIRGHMERLTEAQRTELLEALQAVLSTPDYADVYREGKGNETSPDLLPSLCHLVSSALAVSHVEAVNPYTLTKKLQFEHQRLNQSPIPLTVVSDGSPIPQSPSDESRSIDLEIPLVSVPTTTLQVASVLGIFATYSRPLPSRCPPYTPFTLPTLPFLMYTSEKLSVSVLNLLDASVPSLIAALLVGPTDRERKDWGRALSDGIQDVKRLVSSGQLLYQPRHSGTDVLQWGTPLSNREITVRQRMLSSELVIAFLSAYPTMMTRGVEWKRSHFEAFCDCNLPLQTARRDMASVFYDTAERIAGGQPAIANMNFDDFQTIEIIFDLYAGSYFAARLAFWTDGMNRALSSLKQLVQEKSSLITTPLSLSNQMYRRYTLLTGDNTLIQTLDRT